MRPAASRSIAGSTELSTQPGLAHPAPQAGDAEFLRRVSLDLAGMPPAVEELREFLADRTADKRAREIERLLSSPFFARHWATTLDVMLMKHARMSMLPTWSGRPTCSGRCSRIGPSIK